MLLHFSKFPFVLIVLDHVELFDELCLEGSFEVDLQLLVLVVHLVHILLSSNI